MTRFASLVCLLALGAVMQPAQGADFSDPTWPCVQRKVENLSLGLMWPDPVDSAAAPTDPGVRADVDDLAAYLALRRIDLDDAGPRVASFAEEHGGDPELLGHVFAGAFQTLAKRRSRIIGGIGDFSLGQIALSKKIDATRGEMDAVMAAAEPDFDRADVLEEQLDWDQLIYTDRQRSIQYLCETPTLLERRLFEISQMLRNAAHDDG